MRFHEAIRDKARTRQWGRCGSCGDPIDYTGELIYPLVPEARGGRTTLDNCVVLCSGCFEDIPDQGLDSSPVRSPKSSFRYYHGR